jgi:gluconolactonase
MLRPRIALRCGPITITANRRAFHPIQFSQGNDMTSTVSRRSGHCFAMLIAGALAVSSLPVSAQSPVLQMLSKNRQIELVAKGGQFLEGPLFDREGTLWLVEVLGGWLSRVEGDRVVRVAQASPDSQPQGAALHKDGRIFITDRRLGVWTYEPKSKKIDFLIRYYHGQPFKGPNDLTFDDDGNLYFTDAWQTGADDPTGALFMADAASAYRKLTKLVGNLAMPNGVGIPPDGNSIYVSELRKNRNWRCPFDKNNGGLFSCYVATHFLSGTGPDGMKIDEKGFVYQASFNSQGIYVVDPNNEIVEFIRIPSGRFTTNLVFQPGTKWLYITEAQQNNVWRVEVDNAGMTLWGLK